MEKNKRHSVFISMGASNHSKAQRENYDYYATDPTAINDLFFYEEFDKYIWEPCCGEGHLSKKMIELGKNVKSTDLIDRGYGVGNINFLNQNNKYVGDIITNPPYTIATEVVYKALELTNRKVAMFLKIQFLEGKERQQLFNTFPPKRVLIYSFRKMCYKNGDFKAYNSSAMMFCWVIWDKEYQGKTYIDWIRELDYTNQKNLFD